MASHVRWSLTRGSHCSDFTENILVFGKVVADGSWSLTKDGRTGRFGGIAFLILCLYSWRAYR